MMTVAVLVFDILILVVDEFVRIVLAGDAVLIHVSQKVFSLNLA